MNWFNWLAGFLCGAGFGGIVMALVDEMIQRRKGKVNNAK